MQRKKSQQEEQRKNNKIVEEERNNFQKMEILPIGLENRLVLRKRKTNNKSMPQSKH